MKRQDEKQYWLDERRNVDKIVYGLYTVCALLFLADALYNKHTYFGFEHWFGFYAVFGFVACVALVLIAKAMRHLVMREEDYYGDDAPLSGDQGDD